MACFRGIIIGLAITAAGIALVIVGIVITHLA